MMKKLILASILTLASLSTFAASTISTTNTNGVVLEKGDKLISIQNMTEGKETIQLPTIQKADGSVCTSYVASVAVEKDANQQESIKTSVKEFCSSDKEKLSALQNVEKDGFTTQVPKIQAVKG